MSDQVLFLFIPLGLFLGAGVLGWRMAGRGQARGAVWIGGSLLILMASFILYAQRSADQWGGIAIVFMSVTGLGPVVLGLWLGALAGWWRTRGK
ncbi:hypothetical protein ACFORG_17415 [Lutimaribacter marinistellae]|uniref:Uncharacterized protein n=1 Tax=Lutimaribacter marinistellae TaxID=1820329 RepID=A0ABV7TM52_9RHOB